MRAGARVASAGAAFALWSILAMPAAGAQSEGLDVEVVGGGGPLFEVTGMYPGFEESASIAVSNPTAGTSTVALRVTDLSSNDNGCNEPESVIDDTCGSGDGELDEQVTMMVERSVPGGGHEMIVADRPLTGLGDGVVLEAELPSGGTVTYRLTLALPFTSGNETQTDSLDFDIEILGEGTSAGGPQLRNEPTPGPEVKPDDGAGTGAAPRRGGGTEVRRPRTDVLESEVTLPAGGAIPARVTTGANLPTTGRDVIGLASTGSVAMGVGAALALIASMRRRRARSG